MKTVNGTVIELKSRGLNKPTVVIVEYIVDNEKYTIEETVKLRYEAIKIGFLPIGQRGIPKVDCRVGNTVVVEYDESHPEKGHIQGNDGPFNI